MASKNQGLASRNNKTVGVRVGDRSKNVSPRGVSQVGSSLGNHVTESGGKKGGAVEAVYAGRAPAGGPGGVPLGNAVALNVGGGGPGKGRDFVSKSGSNCVTGPVAGSPRPAGRDILSDYGPDSAGVRGRR
jgi:hypothetical protein